MADKKSTAKTAERSTEAAPNQPAKDREDIISRSQAGTASATGYERQRTDPDTDTDIPRGEDRGSKVAIEGEPESDYPDMDYAKPQGAQAKPANMAVNGTVPVNMVPTPSGPVPIGATRSQAIPAKELVQSGIRRGAYSGKLEQGTKLSEDDVRKLDGPTLRAIAADRGYNVGMGGTNAIRQQFLEAQEKDSIRAEASGAATEAWENEGLRAAAEKEGILTAEKSDKK